MSRFTDLLAPVETVVRQPLGRWSVSIQDEWAPLADRLQSTEALGSLPRSIYRGAVSCEIGRAHV